MLEKVQHQFTRMVPGMKELPYKDRLKQLGLWTLEERRNRADLLEMFKMLIGKSSPKFEKCSLKEVLYQLQEVIQSNWSSIVVNWTFGSISSVKE